MKTAINLLLFSLVFISIVSSYGQPRVEIPFNQNWLFYYYPSAALDTATSAIGFDDSAWPAVSVPHTWQTHETTREVHPFIANPSPNDDPYWWKGWGWYRKQFTLEQNVKGKKVFIEFDGVQKVCHLWLNGSYVGHHAGGFTSFHFDLTDHLLAGQTNVLAMAVSNDPIDPYQTPPMSAGNWNLYGGIYRDVKVVIKNEVHVPFQGSARHEGGTHVVTEVRDTLAMIYLKTYVKNEERRKKCVTLVSKLYDAQNTELATIKSQQGIAPDVIASFTQQMTVVDPKLWAPGHPYLYKVESKVYVGDHLEDIFYTPLGIRTFHWDYTENRLYLNGEPVHIHGTNRMQEYPWLGDAVPDWLHYRDLYDIRYRLQHNFLRPNVAVADPYVLDLCDSMGMIAVEEVPNFKRIDFSEEVQRQMVIEMIRRDRNRPSIFFWSMGNETSDAADSQWAYAEDSTRIISARHVYNASAGDFAFHTHEHMDLENLLRCTVRGWYNEDVKDLAPANNQHTGHEEHQHRMARVTDGSQRGRIDMPNGVMFLYADHGADREYKYCPLKHINPKGWVDAYRQPKYIYHLWRANYAKEPMVFVHPYHWQKKFVGSRRDLVVDSNCDSVALYRAGERVGVTYPSWQNFFTSTFQNVQVKAGELLAIGYRNGKKVADHRVPMPGVPRRVVLSASHHTLPAALDQVAIITADIVDENGVHVIGANPTLYWNVTGQATLVGAATYEPDLDKEEEKTGVMYIDVPVSNVIRSNGIAGIARVEVQAEGLEKGEVLIDFTPQEAVSVALLQDVEPADAPPYHIPRQPVVFEDKDIYIDRLVITEEDILLDLSSVTDLKTWLLEFLQTANPHADPRSPEVSALLQILRDHLEANHGELVADDYNHYIKLHNETLEMLTLLRAGNYPSAYQDLMTGLFIKHILREGKTGHYQSLKALMFKLQQAEFKVIPVAEEENASQILEREGLNAKGDFAIQFRLLNSHIGWQGSKGYPSPAGSFVILPVE